MTQPYGAKLLTSMMLLGLAMASVLATSLVNITSGLRICLEAGIVMAVASLGPPAIAAFARLHGHSAATIVAMGLCCVTSVWCELHAWTDSQATATLIAEKSLSAEKGAQAGAAWARQRRQQIDEPLAPNVLEQMVDEATQDVNKARAAALKAEETAQLRGVECGVLSSCKNAARALQAARDAVRRLQERLGLAKEKTQLSQLESEKPADGPSTHVVGAIPHMVAQAGGWSGALAERSDQVLFTVLMVALNLAFSVLSGVAFEGAAKAWAIKRGLEWEPSAPEPVVLTPDTRAVRPPTDAELLILHQRYDLRSIETMFTGVPGCSRATLNRRLLALRGPSAQAEQS